MKNSLSFSRRREHSALLRGARRIRRSLGRAINVIRTTTRNITWQARTDLPQNVRTRFATSRIPSSAQLAVLPRVLNRQQRWSLAVAFVLVLTSGGMLFWRTTSRWRITVPKVGGTFTEAIVGTPKTLNPLFAPLAQADIDVTTLLYPGLFTTAFTPNTTEHFVPMLARSVTAAPDGQTYVVILRHDIRWHDGRPLTISDVLFTIERIQDPTVKSPLAPSLVGVKAQATRDDAITFTLSQPSGSFLASLTFGIIPKHRWEKRTDWQAMDPELVGSGPYKFKTIKWTADASVKNIILERNAQWRPAPYLKTFAFAFFPDTQQAIESVRHGATDSILLSAPEDVDAIMATKTKTHEELLLAIPQYTALFFNSREQPIFADPTIRRALRSAVPKRDLVTQIFGSHADVADGPFPPTLFPMSGNHADTYDTALAERLLNQSGWRLVDGIRMNTRKKVLRFSITTSDSPQFTRAATMVAEAWRSIGVHVDVRTIGGSRFFAEIIRPRAYDVLLAGQNLGADPDPFAYWHSSQEDDLGLNWAPSWRNARADELIEQARRTPDMPARLKAYGEFAQLLSDDAPAIFLSYPELVYIIPKRIHGVGLNAIGTPTDRFVGITQWYTKTKSTWRF